MRKLFSVIVMLSLVMGLAACGSDSSKDAPAAEQQAAAPEEGKEEAAAQTDGGALDASELKVVGVIHTTDTFGAMLNKGMQDACDETGAYMYQACHNQNYSEEYNLLQTYSTMDIDGICGVLGGDESCDPMLQEISAKMPLVVLNAVLEEQGSIYAIYNSNNYDLAAQACSYTIDWWKENKADEEMVIATIGAVEGSTAIQQRYDGFIEPLEESGLAYKEVARGYGLAANDVMQKVGDMITANPDLNLILTDNEMAAVGAVNAIVAAHKEDQIKVSTIDVSPQICELLLNDNGVLLCATGQDPYTMGYEGMMCTLEGILGLNEPYTEQQYIDANLFTREDTQAVKEYEEWLNTFAE